jgi:hypothetical protein
MSKKNWINILSVIARTALAFVFVFGQTAWAIQTQNPKDKPTSNAAAKPKQAPANGSTAAIAKAQSGEEETASEQDSSNREDSRHGGQHEGIKVHGHWTIEVRNHEGSLVRHVEFENSLATGLSATDATGKVIVFPGGAALLSAVLSNQWNVAPNWTVLLAGPSGLGNLLTATDAPCPQACSLSEGNNLSVTALGTTPNFTGMQLTGSVVATQVGQISTVATTAFVSCPPFTPNCFPAGATNSGAIFTSSTNFPGSPISVAAGQTIAVTVNISFS